LQSSAFAAGKKVQRIKMLERKSIFKNHPCFEYLALFILSAKNGSELRASPVRINFYKVKIKYSLPIENTMFFVVI
jgi:hypothetical protein